MFDCGNEIKESGLEFARKKKTIMTISKNLWILLWVVLPTMTWAYDFKCNLHCFNGGECRHGKGKFGSYAGMQEDGEEMPWEEAANEKVTSTSMFCGCPIGYTGLQCEIKVKVCGEDGVDSHTCFSGAECAKERSGFGETYFRCECDVANSYMDQNEYASRYCEHIATTFCGGEQHKGNGERSGSYCTNGGKCKAKASSDQKHVGCECLEGFEGDHCQFNTIKPLTLADVARAATKPNVLAIVFGTLAAALFIGTGFLYYKDKKKRKRERRARIRAFGNETSNRRLQADTGEMA